MPDNNRWEEIYKSGSVPWDAGQPDFNLIDTVKNFPVPKCNALDLGCGTGDNSIWLVQNGFKVISTDLSELAIEKARKKAVSAGVECDFIYGDFMFEKVIGAPFGFVFDRGCFHSYKTNHERKKFARNVASHLGDNGLWLTMMGNADEHRPGEGPPQVTAEELVSAVEPCFEILSLESSHFGSNQKNPPRAWCCLMRKRIV